MYWSSIIIFFIVTMSTGALVDLFVKDWRADCLEKLVMRFGVGLASISVLGTIFNLLHVSLDYRIFLATGLIIAVAALVRNRHAFSGEALKQVFAGRRPWAKKSFWYGLFMLVLFAVTVKMYVGGAFRYDYLEDTDPWGYTAVADYIGDNKTFSVPHYSTQYSEPYTQGYQIVMGVFSQTNDSIYWTMKFFSALIVSFGVLFMYYCARRLSGDEDIAVLAGLFLFAVPAWVTHFVYSFHFNMIVFVVLLYVLAQLMAETGNGGLPDCSSGPAGTDPGRCMANRNWIPVGAIVYASLLVNHFFSAFHGTLFCVVFLVTRTLVESRIDWRTVMTLVGGFLLSLLFYVPAYVDHWWVTASDNPLGGVGTLFPLMRFAATPLGIVTVGVVAAAMVFIYISRKHWQPPLENWLTVGNRGLYTWLCGLALVLAALVQPFYVNRINGTGDRYYVWRDFFSADAANLINNPTGLGPVIMSVVMLSLLLVAVRPRRWFHPSHGWVCVACAWVVAAFLLVLGAYFNIALMPFRVWTFLGLFASLFAAWGVVTLCRDVFRRYAFAFAGMLVVATLTIPSSFVPKYTLNAVNTWVDDMIGIPESRELFTWMRNGGIPKSSVVAHLCGDSEFLSGYDMVPPVWDEAFYPKRGVAQPYFVRHPLEMTEEAYRVLKNANVDYVTIGASCLSLDSPAAGRDEHYRQKLSGLMDWSLRDRRLSLVRDNGYEMLFQLK